MNYYFPSILTSLDLSSGELPKSFHTVNSGENAIRLLLRSYGLKTRSKVALPLYVCDSLKEAVLKEGFEPVYLDLKADHTFWSEYAFNEKPAAVILVHLYGFLHPDTDAVMNFCRSNSIFLIHDAAQSYGIDENTLTYGSGLVYSFGPGKSSTAACGAIVKGLSDEFYNLNCKTDSNSFVQNLKAKVFLRSRIYGYKFSFVDKLIQKIGNRFKTNNSINKMSEFQLTAAAAALEMVNKKSQSRSERYRILEEAVKTNALLSIPYNDGKGLYFKMVLSTGINISKFKEYLTSNNVPFFSLKEELFIAKEIQNQFPEFSKNATGFVELSTEASLPMEEIKRVADILKRFS
jgi:dTDP-4-amino-4,6-dideoxygalactose transaminase